jgi:hypothetical protein
MMLQHVLHLSSRRSGKGSLEKELSAYGRLRIDCGSNDK